MYADVQISQIWQLLSMPHELGAVNYGSCRTL